MSPGLITLILQTSRTESQITETPRAPRISLASFCVPSRQLMGCQTRSAWKAVPPPLLFLTIPILLLMRRGSLVKSRDVSQWPKTERSLSYKTVDLRREEER